MSALNLSAGRKPVGFPIVRRLPGHMSALRARVRRHRARRLDRRGLRRMMALDDRLLEDIGVRREDLQQAVNLPLNVDAARALRERTTNRRREANR